MRAGFSSDGIAYQSLVPALSQGHSRSERHARGRRGDEAGLRSAASRLTPAQTLHRAQDGLDPSTRTFAIGAALHHGFQTRQGHQRRIGSETALSLVGVLWSEPTWAFDPHPTGSGSGSRLGGP